MQHYWQDIDGTEVLINSNDGKTPLAYINKENSTYFLKVPYLKISIDIKDVAHAMEFKSLSEAKDAAEREIQRRINEFISPAN